MQPHILPATYQKKRLIIGLPTLRRGINTPPAPDIFGTMIFLCTLCLTFGSIPNHSSVAVAQHAAKWVAIGLAASALFDLRHGFRNMMRADLWMLVALYSLTFLEYLDPRYRQMANNYSANFMRQSVTTVLVGMGVLTIARHLIHSTEPSQAKIFSTPTRSSVMITLFWFCFIVGYMHQWVAVNFNPVTWIMEMTKPRFGAAWGRGMFGDFYAIFYELGMLLNLIAPVGALILVKWRKYGLFMTTLIALALATTFFYFFTEGTRHKFCAQVVMFVISYCYFLRKQPFKTLLIFIAGLSVMFISAKMMLTFRQIGFQTYLQAKSAGVLYQEDEAPLHIDNNLINLGRVLEIFPATEPYVGWNLFYLAIIRPIPRAIWPGKPTGVVEIMTNALKEEGASLTYSITYIGESWLSSGWFAVVATSFVFGLIAAWWNRFGTLRTSEFGLLIYASGFLSLVTGMRSLMVFTTFVLPTLFLILAASYFVGEVLPNTLGKIRQGSQPKIQARHTGIIRR